MGRPAIDRLGHTYGKLKVTGRAPLKNKQARWECVCECGTKLVRGGGHLHETSSCGCGRIKHGHSLGGFSPTYTSWDSMKARCTRPSHPNYNNYGGRGISYDPHWAKFVNFLSDVGERPEGKTLDRIDSNGNYEKTNCRWATPTEQQQNRRCNL